MYSLQQLYLDQLRDIYDAETQLVSALPNLAQAASSPDLKRAFQQHLDQTRQQLQRLDQIFTRLQSTSQGKTCKAMQGLVKEGEEAIREDGDHYVKDAALIAAAQRVEHYEIAAYGTVCAYAEQLGDKSALALLKTTLGEEKDTDQKLTDLAVNAINPNAEKRTSNNYQPAGATTMNMNMNSDLNPGIDQMDTIIALYPTFEDARRAIEALVAAGFDRNRLSLIINDRDERYTRYMQRMNTDVQAVHTEQRGLDGRTFDPGSNRTNMDVQTMDPNAAYDDDYDPMDDDVEAGDGAGFGAVVGTLVGLGVALIPGIGSVVIAGAAGAALFAGIGAAAGALTGGLTAGLMRIGLDEAQAQTYNETITRGGAMVIAKVYENWQDRATLILRQHDPISVEDVGSRPQ